MHQDEGRTDDAFPQESRMSFDVPSFLAAYADAYNQRDPERMRSLFALDDPRFAVFEDFSGELFDGELYGVMLESAFDATGTMSFELLRSDEFGDFTVVHAIQKLVEQDEEEGLLEAIIRATLWIGLSDGKPHVVAAHFSSLPVSESASCPPGGCSGHLI
jgi:hypothetical protein